MDTHKIKILKATPFDKAGVEMTVDTFRLKYGYLCMSSTTNEELITYLKTDKSFSHWFEVTEIPLNAFRIGDWIWHETNQMALLVMPGEFTDKDWQPNYCSFEAANTYLETYKRKATQTEIDYFDLTLVKDSILVGMYKCYYFNTVWKELVGVKEIISSYIDCAKHFQCIEMNRHNSTDLETSWECNLDGLSVGCKGFSHKEIVSLAKTLKLII